MGAGKSTTMQMLTGNLAPSHGTIKIAGMDLMDNPIEAKSHIGYLPDTPPLYKELTVDEYLGYCARLNRIRRGHVSKAVANSKERCGLMEHGRRVISHLSKGYQQRVGIAQAIIHDPDIVIFDEPTVGLDPLQMKEIRKLIKELGESHSVMLSSHILPEIQTVCDNVQIINQGKLVFNASIEQLNQQMHTHTLQVRCSNPVDIKLLEAMDNIKSVESSDDRLILHCSGHPPEAFSENAEKKQDAIIKTSQSIIELAAQNHWGLFEIYPEKRTLEDIFMSLTSQEYANTLDEDNAS